MPKIDLSVNDCFLLREFVASAIRSGFGSRAKRRRVIQIAEHLLLAEALKLTGPGLSKAKSEGNQ